MRVWKFPKSQDLEFWLVVGFIMFVLEPVSFGSAWIIVSMIMVFIDHDPLMVPAWVRVERD